MWVFRAAILGSKHARTLDVASCQILHACKLQLALAVMTAGRQPAGEHAEDYMQDQHDMLPFIVTA